MVHKTDKDSDKSAMPATSLAGKGSAMGAAGLMLLSVSLFTVSHGFVRSLEGEIHPFEVAFSTSLFSFSFYLPWLVHTRFRFLRTKSIGVHWTRACFNAAAVVSWYIAIGLSPLADAVALSLTGPIIVTLGAALLLGEPTRTRRWIAMGAGFIGALMIIRPGFEAFSPGYWFVFASLICTAASRLLTKQLTFSETPAVIGAWMALLQVPITLVLAVFVWTWPNPLQLLVMFTVGILVGAAHFTLSGAYSRADVGAMEPINFMRLVIASFIGFAFFSEIPDTWTWVGGLVIVSSTTYIARREAARRRNALTGTKAER